MSDTIRAEAALQTLLADNTSGAIVPQHVRDFLVSVPTLAITAGNASAQRTALGLGTMATQASSSYAALTGNVQFGSVRSVANGTAEFALNYYDNGLMFSSLGRVTFGATAASPNVAIGYSASGIVEINNGTAGSYRALKLSELFVNGATYLVRASASLTNGSAASVGTLTNAPAAGNPTKWVAVDDNGTTRYLPLW